MIFRRTVAHVKMVVRRLIAKFDFSIDSLRQEDYDIIFYSSIPFEESFLSPLIEETKKYYKVAIVRGRNRLLKPSLKWHDYNEVDIYYINGLNLSRIKVPIFITAKSSGSSILNFPKYSFNIHVPHSLVSLHTIYPENSFLHFDCIFAAGPHHKAEFKCLNASRRHFAYDIGYTRILSLRESYKGVTSLEVFNNSSQTIMIAPSWHEGNLLDLVGVPLIEALLSKGYNVILRPHFKHRQRNPQVISKVLKTFGNRKNFLFDSFRLGNDIFNGVNCMISDYSGVAFEFAFVTFEPCIFVDAKEKMRNTGLTCSHLKPFELEVRGKIGLQTKCDVDSIMNTVEIALKNKSKLREDIKLTSATLVYNLESGVVDSAMLALNEIFDKNYYKEKIAH